MSKTTETTTNLFFIGACSLWKCNHTIQVTINSMQKKHSLRWLHTSMSYHRFTNLIEEFTGNLTSKLNKNIVSKDFKPLPCNYNTGFKVDSQCIVSAGKAWWFTNYPAKKQGRRISEIRNKKSRKDRSSHEQRMQISQEEPTISFFCTALCTSILS